MWLAAPAPGAGDEVKCNETGGSLFSFFSFQLRMMLHWVTCEEESLVKSCMGLREQKQGARLLHGHAVCIRLHQRAAANLPHL